MQPGDVCQLLQITKDTVYKYRREGKISRHKLPNGYWNWGDGSVYSYFNKDVPRLVYAYARVSTYKQVRQEATKLNTEVC